MARRALAAIVLVALGAVGAASAGLVAAGTGTSGCGAVTTVAARTTSIPTTTTTSMVYTPPPACPRTASTGSKTSVTATTSTADTTTTSVPTLTTSRSASTIVITGHGWGHGVGMGQWGAYGYAVHGWSYERILSHYYRGTTLGKGPAPNVRVLLVDGARRVTLDSASPWRVVDARGTKLALPPGKLAVAASLGLAGHGLVSPLTFVPGGAPLQVGGRAYRGRLLVVSNGHRLQVINELGLERYLDGVIGGEMPNSWPEAALEAQAVAARSFAVAKVERLVTASPYELYADTRSQVYGGIAAESPAVTRAVSATAGLVVLYQGRVATTVFSSTTGGRTASAAEGFGKAIPYLVSVPDPYDTTSPYHDWGPVLLNAADAGRELGLGGPLVSLQAVPGPSGRIQTVTAIGASGQLTLSGAQVRDDLGLRSNWFQLGWLTLTPPTAPLPYGHTTSLTGTARGVAGVSLEAKTPGTGWQEIETVATDGTGAFSVRVRPKETTRYRLAAGEVRGALIRVAVTPRVSAAVAAAGVEGTVLPALAGAPVALQQQEGSRWLTVASTRTGEGGAFVIQARLAPGAYRVRCTPGHSLVPGVSSLLTTS